MRGSNKFNSYERATASWELISAIKTEFPIKKFQNHTAYDVRGPFKHANALAQQKKACVIQLFRY